jgi:hypothetical protein
MPPVCHSPPDSVEHVTTRGRDDDAVQFREPACKEIGRRRRHTGGVMASRVDPYIAAATARVATERRQTQEKVVPSSEVEVTRTVPP